MRPALGLLDRLTLRRSRRLAKRARLRARRSSANPSPSPSSDPPPLQQDRLALLNTCKPMQDGVAKKQADC